MMGWDGMGHFGTFFSLGCARRYRLACWVGWRRGGGGGERTSRSAEMHAACVRVVYSAFIQITARGWVMKLGEPFLLGGSVFSLE